MNSREQYKSNIELKNDFLDIDLTYERPATKEEVGRDETEVRPKEGELRTLTTKLSVRMGEPLSKRLKILVKAPYAYIKLISDLERYKEGHELSDDEARLINYAIKEVWNSLE